MGCNVPPGSTAFSVCDDTFARKKESTCIECGGTFVQYVYGRCIRCEECRKIDRARSGVENAKR